MRTTGLAIFCALALASSLSQGQPMERWYAGGAIGQGMLKIDDGAVAVSGLPSSITKEESDTGYKLFVGHRFTPALALEAGYVDFGKFNARNNTDGSSFASLDVKMNGFNIDGVGTLPLGNRFALHLRLGGIISETKVSRAAGGLITLQRPASEKKSEVNFHFGAGASYEFSRSFAVRAEYEQAQSVGDKDTTGEGSPALLSLGVVVKF